MNQLFRVIITLVLFVGLTLCLISCKPKPSLAVVTTAIVTGVTQTTATTGGNVTDDGNAEVTARGVCWSTSQNPTTGSSKTSDGKGTGNFTSNITGLIPGTSYYARAYATNSEGTSYGNEISFSSNPIILASLTTANVTSITSTTAISGGNITSDGGSAITERGVCWSISANPTISDNKTQNGTGNGIFTSELTELLPNTSYHIRAFALNTIGYSYGNDLTFTTLASVPLLTTNSISELTMTTVTSGGNITSDGGLTISARGICWGTTPNPDVNGAHTSDGTGTGIFTSDLTGLTQDTKYYIRAYATNSLGTGYGDEKSFTTMNNRGILFNPDLTYGSITDIDGNVYKTIQIGTQTWMAENLKTTNLNDGTALSYNLSHEASYCWYNNDEITYRNTYGALYTGYARSNSRLCPTGWHVPSDAEWTTLTNWLGLLSIGDMKETGTTHWNIPNGDATNLSGFTALPGGSRSSNGEFGGIGTRGSWWSTSGYNRSLSYLDGGIGLFLDFTNSYHSVRCLKD